MKTQKITQQQNSQIFQGNVFLTNKLSKTTNAQMEHALPVLKEMFKKKPYDLFIKEDEAKKCLLFTVKNGQSSKNSSTVALVNGKVRHATTFYCDMADFIKKEYEKSIETLTFKDKFKNYINVFGKKIFKILTDD